MKDETKIDDQRTIGFYQAMLAEHGDTYKALDWGSRESQLKRFEVLADVGIMSGDHILDIGCGLADFNAWLIKHKPGVRYSGIDITPEMVEQARCRFPNIDISNMTLFDLDSDLGIYDYLVASGIFFFRKEQPKRYMKESISHMFELSKKGIAFNTLSSWKKDKINSEFYASPIEVINYCKTLSPFVVLRHDYHPGDFTIYVYKKNKYPRGS